MQNGISTFSTIDCIQNLKKAGFTPEQAEAQAKEFERSRIDLLSLMATKKDIEELKKDTVTAIEKISNRVDTLSEKTGEKIQNQTKEIGNQARIIMAFLGGLILLMKFQPEFFNK